MVIYSISDHDAKRDDIISLTVDRIDEHLISVVDDVIMRQSKINLKKIIRSICFPFFGKAIAL